MKKTLALVIHLTTEAKNQLAELSKLLKLSDRSDVIEEAIASYYKEKVPVKDDNKAAE